MCGRRTHACPTRTAHLRVVFKGLRSDTWVGLAARMVAGATYSCHARARMSIGRHAYQYHAGRAHGNKFQEGKWWAAVRVNRTQSRNCGCGVSELTPNGDYTGQCLDEQRCAGRSLLYRSRDGQRWLMLKSTRTYFNQQENSKRLRRPISTTITQAQLRAKKSARTFAANRYSPEDLVGTFFVHLRVHLDRPTYLAWLQLLHCRRPQTFLTLPSTSGWHMR